MIYFPLFTNHIFLTLTRLVIANNLLQQQQSISRIKVGRAEVACHRIHMGTMF
jgi:hypothetical protein